MSAPAAPSSASVAANPVCEAVLAPVYAAATSGSRIPSSGVAAGPGATDHGPLPPEWASATPQQLAVLQRIAAQRQRLRLARQTGKTKRIRRQMRGRVDADAPLWQRTASFVRLHPIFALVVAGAAWTFGPRKLLGIGSTLLPLLLKMRRR